MFSDKVGKSVRNFPEAFFNIKEGAFSLRRGIERKHPL